MSRLCSPSQRRRSINHQHLDRAAPLLERLETREPANLRTVLLKARLARLGGKPTVAVDVLKQSLGAAQNDGEKLAIAFELEAAGSLDAAEAIYRAYKAGGKEPERVVPLGVFLRGGAASMRLCRSVTLSGPAARQPRSPPRFVRPHFCKARRLRPRFSPWNPAWSKRPSKPPTPPCCWPGWLVCESCRSDGRRLKLFCAR